MIIAEQGAAPDAEEYLVHPVEGFSYPSSHPPHRGEGDGDALEMLKCDECKTL